MCATVIIWSFVSLPAGCLSLAGCLWRAGWRLSERCKVTKLHKGLEPIQKSQSVSVGGADSPAGLGTKDHQHPPIIPATHRKDLLACPLSQEEGVEGGLKHWQACNTMS